MIRTWTITTGLVVLAAALAFTAVHADRPERKEREKSEHREGSERRDRERSERREGSEHRERSERKSKTGQAKKAVKEADNSYCLVCHANLEEEKFTVMHKPAGVGCQKCHGDSLKHSSDEDGLTPPDKMFTKGSIKGFCITCHEKDQLLEHKEHKPLFAANADTSKTCTNCHGKKHHIAVRTRIWDKTTGKLISDDGVRMMQKKEPAKEEKKKP